MIVWALAIFGGVLGLLIARHGVAGTDDGDTYLGVAHNLASGHGLTVPYQNVLDQLSPARAASFDGAIPLTLFPPLFPLVLAPLELFGINSADALRVLNPLCLGATLALIGLLGLRVTRRSLMLTLGVAALALQAYMLQLFGFVQSEPLYLVTSLGALLVLDRYLRRPTRIVLVWFGLLAAAAACTRFVGVSVIATGAIALGCWSDGGPASRWRRAIFLGAASLTPLIVFSLWGSVTTKGRNRLGWHLPSAADFRDVLNSVTRWLVPIDPFRTISPGERTSYSLVLGGALVLVAVLAWFARRQRRRPDGLTARNRALDDSDRLVGIIGIALASYLVVLLAARTFTDASPSFQFGGRLLVPALPLLWLLCAGVIASYAHWCLPPTAARWTVVTAGAVALLLGVGLLAQSSWNVLGWPDGPGVNGPVSASPTLNFLQHRPRDTLVMTNDPGRVWRETGLHTIAVPSKVLPLTGKTNDALPADLQELRHLLRRHDAYVVYVDGSFLTSLHLLPERDVVAQLGLRQVMQEVDGRVYQLGK